MRTAPRRHESEAGFTLIELLGVVTVFAIIAGMAVPALKDMSDSMRLGQAAREVERELQTARLKAVTSSRPIRVRFNCPTAGKYRMVELIGTPTANAATDWGLGRCNETVFPPGATDNNPLTVPNHDGPLRTLHKSVSFGATQTLEFWPDGSVHSDPTGNPPAGGSPWPLVPAAGTAITLTKSGAIKTITVNGLGKIQLK
jgi:prepilin-type N-terminal cleavage/methylation domain-containing protein